ncbi:MAG: carboxypeptidase regulatory-like domain-containing protein [Acidobacteria bacterium]|nr:carboxypeptidase regulatory-like domain-containing protein [Acidobacteriota bacterium]
MTLPGCVPISGQHRSRRQAACALVGLLLWTRRIGAQIHSRSVRGKVTDQRGALLKGATVRLKNRKTLNIRSYIVQQDGAYQFTNLQSGASYDLKAEFLGATSATAKLDQFDSREEALIDLKVELK